MAPCLRGMYDLWVLAQLSAVLGDLSSQSLCFLLFSFPPLLFTVFLPHRRVGLKHQVKTVFRKGQPLGQTLWVHRIVLKRDVYIHFLLTMAVVIHRMMIKWWRRALQPGIYPDAMCSQAHFLNFKELIQVPGSQSQCSMPDCASLLHSSSQNRPQHENCTLQNAFSVFCQHAYAVTRFA